MGAGLSLIAVFIAIRCWTNDYKLKTNVEIFAVGGAVYICGALLYVLRVPERWAPGKFDMCGASH
jgi:predicted membrane channel-forming protein YqfA (hemolysin III family)